MQFWLLKLKFSFQNFLTKTIRQETDRPKETENIKPAWQGKREKEKVKYRSIFFLQSFKVEERDQNAKKLATCERT